MEFKKLLPTRDRQSCDNHSDDDWSNGSSCSSYDSNSDSTIPDWEPYVDDFSGELLYIDCHPFVTHNREPNNKSNNQLEPFSKSQLRRSTRGKFLRLLRKRESKRHTKKPFSKQTEDGADNTQQKVKFQDFQEGEQKTVTLEIDAENRYNLSSDKSLAESLLGLIVSTLSDGSRVMIAGFSYDSKARNERNIKIGDWLKSINNIDVNVQNLDDILQKFINHDEVILTLQRVAATEVTKDPPINELNLESVFVKELLNARNECDQDVLEKLCSYPLGMVFLDTDKLTESNTANEDVIYCFPRPLEKNILCSSRGMFLTLSHLLHDITKVNARTSSLLYKGKLMHIAYSKLQKYLLLLMLPDKHASIKEIVLIQTELMRYLEFCYESLEKCFTVDAYVGQVDVILARYFSRMISGSDWITTQEFLELRNTFVAAQPQNNCLFEEVMPVVPSLKVHNDAVMQIDDALTELEASDYREWNEDPLDCQRLFTMLGSALFHSGYLLHSHLTYEDLVDVYSFCKLEGVVHLSKTEPVKSLVMWREIFPQSCRRQEYIRGRRYLLVVGSGKDFLAVIMEAGGATEAPDDNMGPDAFYVEEAQATLAHVQELGLDIVAERFILSHNGFQLSAPTPVVTKKKSDFIGSLGFAKSTVQQHPKEVASTVRKSEVTSILKRRSSEQNVTNSPDDSYEVYSEESGSQGYNERMSEISDESGSRGPRTNDEESDLDDFADGSQISTSSFDISEVRHSLLSELGECSPLQVTSGPHNVLHHFAFLDMNEGILITPLENSFESHTYSLILNNFKRSCQNIHGVFQKTLRFKSMPAQDIAKTLMNKSLIAIKEYGVLFECPFLDEKDGKKNRTRYWVTGRLFYVPHPKELYVCYQDTVPQNMIDLAFKISLHSAI